MGDQYEPLGPASGQPPAAPPAGAANAAAGTDAGGKTELFSAMPEKTDLQSVVDPGKKPAGQDDPTEKTNLQSLQEPSNPEKQSTDKDKQSTEEKKHDKASAKDKKNVGDESSARPSIKEKLKRSSKDTTKLPLFHKPIFFFILSVVFFIVSIACFAFLAVSKIKQ